MAVDDTGPGPEGMTTDLQITLARNADAFRIAYLSRARIEAGLPWTWRPERVASAIKSPEVNVIVANVGECFAGFCITQFGTLTAHHCLLAVSPGFPRRGIGTSLIRWQEKVAITAGLMDLELELRASNTEALAFYHSLGYREFALARGYYSSMEDARRLRHQIRQRDGNSA
ncbi:MAG: GNAT family N-acetyltransferase [Gammaproteobacteria bacterium]